MLTDYHVHLRPDDPGTLGRRYFTAANAERYREAATERGVAELGVSEHIHRFTAAARRLAAPVLAPERRRRPRRYVGFVREETDLRLGIEADYVARPRGPDGARCSTRTSGTTCRLGALPRRRRRRLRRRRPEHVWRHGDAPERVWQRYFEALAESARTGPLRHHRPPRPGQDLGLRRGRSPSSDPRHYYEPAVEAMLEAGVAMEVSTAGLRKPVGEIYPARALLEMAVDAGHADRALLRRAPARAARLRLRRRAWSCSTDVGVTEICVFERRDAPDGAARLMSPHRARDRHAPLRRRGGG